MDSTMLSEIVDADLLIVGAGPAGASLACFLASHGHTGIIVSAAAGTADTPRAHITNAAALECFRDIDLERECISAASHGEHMEHTRWCRSMAGEEFARIHSWGNDPKRYGDYAAASPCSHADLPQTELEPILTRRASQAGWKLRFHTSFIAIREKDDKQVISEVRDNVTNVTYLIRSRFLFGCDGARSQVLRELKLPLIKKPGQGLATNVLVKVDLSSLMKYRTGNLHWVFDPEEGYPAWAWACIVRMVRPWDEWMFIFLPRPGADSEAPEMDATIDQYLSQVQKVIGDATISPKVVDVSKWRINEVVAEKYSDGNVFCLGDAVHRHPPFNGLGSNTCVQDAFNLAWKVAYVMSGAAGPILLDSYSTERQPVGVGIVTRANQGLRDHIPWMTTIGMLETDVEKRRQILTEFRSTDEAGRKRRAAWQQAIGNTATEFHGLGVEMNQFYVSDAVYASNEQSPYDGSSDDVLHYSISTYPGKRLPHAWLNKKQLGVQISTIDLAGKGSFCLLTGPGGEEWKDAAREYSASSAVSIQCYSIGWDQDYEDVYFDWARLREVEEDGCVLIRPDRFVAWRSATMEAGCNQELKVVMDHILSKRVHSR